MSAGERARLFVALELPGAARVALERWRSASVQATPDLRFVASEALHVTLCFLGWQQTREIDAIAEACGAAIEGHARLELALGQAVWLPERRPRVLAVLLKDPSAVLARLQASLSEALSGGGWYEPETRPFLAHVTVARLARGGRVQRADLPVPPARAFTATEVTLFRSRLEPGGARYEALRTVSLGRI